MQSVSQRKMVTDINMSGVWMFMQIALRIVLGPPSHNWLIDMHQRNGNYDLRVIRVRADLANTIQLFLFANDNIVNVYTRMHCLLMKNIIRQRKHQRVFWSSCASLNWCL